eukprot:3727854-Rhodomonas_salina.1
MMEITHDAENWLDIQDQRVLETKLRWFDKTLTNFEQDPNFVPVLKFSKSFDNWKKCTQKLVILRDTAVNVRKLRDIIYTSRSIDDKIQQQFNEGGGIDIIALQPEASKLFDRLAKRLTIVIDKVQKARVEYEDELYGEATTPRGDQISMQLMERIQ